MTKATVTRLFISSLIAGLAGAVILIVAVTVALANGAFVFEGSQIVDIRMSGMAVAAFGLGLVGALTLVGAAIVGLISWIGALLNTAQLPGKGWFVGLLLLGIFNFGFLAMIAYVIAGPDGAPKATPIPATTPVGAAA